MRNGVGKGLEVLFALLQVGSFQDGEEDNLDWKGSRDGILGPFTFALICCYLIERNGEWFMLRVLVHIIACAEALKC